MMGPLAGVGDPVFWFTVRPMLGALGASLAMGGNILGPILFFVAWNLIRWSFMWYTQEFGYKAVLKLLMTFQVVYYKILQRCFYFRDVRTGRIGSTLGID